MEPSDWLLAAECGDFNVKHEKIVVEKQALRPTILQYVNKFCDKKNYLFHLSINVAMHTSAPYPRNGLKESSVKDIIFPQYGYFLKDLGNILSQFIIITHDLYSAPLQRLHFVLCVVWTYGRSAADCSLFYLQCNEWDITSILW